jgi:hypothetical protein
MRATLTLEDTPKGISAELRWEGNDVTDHLHTSLSMSLMAQFTELIKSHAKAGAIYLEKE